MKNYPLYQHISVTDLKQLIRVQADRIGQRTAVQYMENSRIVSVSYSEFQEDIYGLGTYLWGKGLKNRKVAVIGENSYQWVLTYFAVVIGSGVIVPIDKDLSADDIEKLLLHCGADMLVCSPECADTAAALLQRNAVSEVIHMADFPALIQAGKTILANGDTRYADDPIDGGALCTILFTSGTTGEPKGVMLTQKGLITDSIGACQNIVLSGPTLLTLPLYHVYAFSTSVLMTLIYGNTICIDQGVRTFMRDLRIFKPQNLFLVPLYIENLCDRVWNTAKAQNKLDALNRKIRFSSALRKIGIDLRRRLFRAERECFGGELELIISGGAAMDQSYIDRLDSIGIQVLVGYGATECAILSVNRNRFYRRNSMGLALPCCDVRIIDGEICAAGDNVMLGYYNNEAATREVFHGAYFKTGDLGYIDEDGFIFFTGRKKNLIILSNGQNVSPEELENRIRMIPNVLEVLVRGEDGMITAEIYAETQDGIREAIDALNDTVPGYKRIQAVRFRQTAFEKTGTAKILRSGRARKP